MLLEDKIRNLCKQAIQALDEEDGLRILEELRSTLQNIDGVGDKSFSFSAPRTHVSEKKAA